MPTKSALRLVIAAALRLDRSLTSVEKLFGGPGSGPRKGGGASKASDAPENLKGELKDAHGDASAFAGMNRDHIVESLDKGASEDDIADGLQETFHDQYGRGGDEVNQVDHAHVVGTAIRDMIGKIKSGKF
jgi:hypothetical protein